MSVQKFQVTNSTAFKWSDDTLFNGYALVILAFPSSNSGISWDYAVLNDNEQRLRLPLVSRFPIREGYFVSDCYLWGNTGTANSIHPPKTSYAFLFYDNTDRLIAINNGTYIVDEDVDFDQSAFTIPTSTLGMGHGESSPGAVPTVETPTGTIDGSNVTFTLSRVPTQLILFNGTNSPLAVGVGYTISGAILTLTDAPTEANARYFKAYIF